MPDVLAHFSGVLHGVIAGLADWWPVLAAAVLVEVLRPGRRLHWPTVLANVVYLPLGLALGVAVLGSALQSMQAHLPADLFALRAWATTSARQFALWLGYLACFDFLYYWLHRAQHRVPWLWRYHMVHHADENVSASTVGRHHWLEEGFRFFIITAPLIVLLGGVAGAPLWVATFIGVNGIFMHWNVALRFGPLEHWIITPAYHRIHHSVEHRHWDRNFGVFTQLWDRVFGTRYVPAKDEYPSTGIAGLGGVRAWALLAPWPLIMIHEEKTPLSTGEVSGQ
ncbi:sterol desaturase family protein [Pulveribacter sp.]|uniref:sterol desaturase family protein n=1 Tax=Pulveribacter sp. TaxID=2678893 RepID=UPI0028AAECA5|nr:sterol desaturase family protein [Pulveribacter sp.]